MSTPIELLRELAALKRYGKNGHPNRSEYLVTLNVPTELLERVDAAISDQNDVDRINFIIDKQGIIVSKTGVDGVRRYQLYQICEYGIGFALSGNERWFDTPREAIDAAIAASEPKTASDMNTPKCTATVDCTNGIIKTESCRTRQPLIDLGSDTTGERDYYSCPDCGKQITIDYREND